MRIWIAIGWMIGSLALPAGAARAGEVQAAPLSQRGIVPPAAEERSIACRDFRNRPVRIVDVADLGDAGRAEFVQGNPVIMLDPALMGKLPETLQLFFKLHECGHHVLGHLFAPTEASEREADCWAVKQGRKLGLYTHDDIVGWLPHFAASRGSAFGHLPGPQRVEFLAACFEGTETALYR
jgi:hypothetical protein